MITKQTAVDFRKDFSLVVKELEEKYNVKIELGSITYNSTSFHGRITCTEISEEGEKVVDMQEFNLTKNIYGFKGNIGDTYNDGNHTFKVIGLDSRKPKYPVILEREDGKRFKSTINAVNFYLSMKGK